MAKADAVIEMLHKASSQMKSLLQTRCAGLIEIGSHEPINFWLDEDREAIPNLLITESGTKTNSVDETGRLLRTLKSLGTVRFFHRTARDFLLDKSAGKELMKTHSLSKGDIVERLLRARLAIHICGMCHRPDLEALGIWRSWEYGELCRMIDLILGVDKSDADKQAAEFQYKLLQHIEITYSQKLISEWDNFVDQACRRNWYLAITHRLGPLHLWGEVMCHVLSSALTTTILRNGPGDKEFATYLLYELCQKRSYNEADIQSVQLLLGAGADPNATDVLCSRDGFQHSLWHQFVIDYMETGKDEPAQSNDQSMQAQTIATVKCFLHPGADLSRQLVVVRNIYIDDWTYPIEGIGRYIKGFDHFRWLAPGSKISIINGAYLLRQLSLTFPNACREGNLAEFTMPGDLAPSCRDLAIVGYKDTLHRLPQAGPDLLIDMRMCPALRGAVVGILPNFNRRRVPPNNRVVFVTIEYNSISYILLYTPYIPSALLDTRQMTRYATIGVTIRRAFGPTIRMASTSNTPLEDTIRRKVTDALNPTNLTIRNDSHLHSHHKAMVGSTSKETHFYLDITSPSFASKPQPARHRMIYALLKEELEREGGIHALQLRTKTPEEVEREKARNPPTAS
ncbi:hypothetical protein PV04_00590 [Phialophora macrospora]|uniref:DUF7791 domain-containing protein n=1 Tax=Phialophora macrospora TaxID=1851006 RepID=A0A0D2FV84_9EURO|nr:hypothetical protein PV04_00590 [Phialophora macrospora]